MLKMPLFLSNSCHFSVHKTEISKFLARIHMKYFQMGIFVIRGVCLIRKYGSQTTAFFSVFQCFSGYRGCKIILFMCTIFRSLVSKTVNNYLFTIFGLASGWLRDARNTTVYDGWNISKIKQPYATRRQPSPLLYSIDIRPARNSRLTQRETNY